MYSAFAEKAQLWQGPQPHSPACSVPTALSPDDTCALSQEWADLLTLLMVDSTSSGLVACGTLQGSCYGSSAPPQPAGSQSASQPRSGRDEIVT